MLGELTNEQIDLVLRSELVGRIGCTDKNNVFIVPVTYVYDGGYIYVHSKEGHKVKIMRENPNVCFQVDSIDSMTYWRSVIIQGQYEELTTDRMQLAALQLISDRLAPYSISETVRPTSSYKSAELSEKGLKVVAYRIKIIEKTGRFEKV